MQMKLIDLKPGKVFVWKGVVFVTTNRKWFNYFSDFVVCLKISDGTLSALDGSLLVEVNYGEDDLELLAIDALEHFGDTAQICQTMEECAELIQALNKTLRHVTDSEQVRRNVLEELADVTIGVCVVVPISDGTLSALDGSLLVEVNYGEDDLELLAIDALEHFGDTAQICQTMEECAELIQALNKTLRHVTDSEQVRRNVLEELADVTIMVEQMKQNFDEGEEFNEILEEKMNKLRGYLENQEADR